MQVSRIYSLAFTIIVTFIERRGLNIVRKGTKVIRCMFQLKRGTWLNPFGVSSAAANLLLKWGHNINECTLVLEGNM